MSYVWQRKQSSIRVFAAFKGWMMVIDVLFVQVTDF
jgi:hypothetical protein